MDYDDWFEKNQGDLEVEFSKSSGCKSFVKFAERKWIEFESEEIDRVFERIKDDFILESKGVEK